MVVFISGKKKIEKLQIKFITADKKGFLISKKRISDEMGYEIDLVPEQDRFKYIEDLYGFEKCLTLFLSIFLGLSKIERQALGLNQYNVENLNNQIKNNLKIKPNIYYLVLDHYPRSDLLKEFYDYDNSSFIKKIKKNGYKVAEKSLTNAIGTDPNMTIVFDMKTDIFKKYLEDKKSFYIGEWLRGKTAVNTIFKKIGYKKGDLIKNPLFLYKTDDIFNA